MVFCSALLEICTHVDLVIFKTANKKYLAKPIPLLLNDRLMLSGSNFLEIIFKGELLCLRIEGGKIWITASNGMIISEFVKTEDYAKLLECFRDNK